MIHKIFEKLQADKENYLKSKKGKDFEDRIENLISEYFTRIIKDDFENILVNLKNEILVKTEESFIKNRYNKNKHFIVEPYSSQSYPDILIFDEDKIIAIEIKFTENKKLIPFGIVEFLD